MFFLLLNYNDGPMGRRYSFKARDLLALVTQRIFTNAIGHFSHHTINRW